MALVNLGFASGKEKKDETDKVYLTEEQMDEIKDFLENYIDEHVSHIVADMKESNRTAIAQLKEDLDSRIREVVVATFPLSGEELKQVRELIVALKNDKEPTTGRE